MVTKQRLAIATIAIILLALVFVSLGGIGGISRVLAQNYFSGNPAAPAVTSCGFDLAPQPNAGVITVTTPVYYAPNASNVIVGLTLTPGSKWLVIGVDSTKHYYKIEISCSLAWIPVNTIAPINGAPLSSDVVSDSLSTPN